MDDFLNKNKNETDPNHEPAAEVKKIEFKYIKEKRCMRTYILNLEHHIQDDATRANLMTRLKKALGTACVYKETEFGFGYGINGDFKKKITSYLVDNNIVPKEAFK